MSNPLASHFSAGVSRNDYKVLVVDDNLDGATTLSMLLELSGFEAESVHDGPSALRAAMEFRPDAVVLDIGLPGLDGYQVARRLRSSPELTGMVIIALTGHGQDADRERSRQAGFDHHFVKPTDPSTLCDVLARYAASRPPRQ